MVLVQALKDFSRQTWPWEEADLAEARSRSCFWGLSQGSAEVSASVRRSRRSRPERRRRGPGGRPGGPRQPAAPLIQNSSGMNWDVPASLPRPTHRFLPGRPPQQGGRHCPDSGPHRLHSWAMITPLCPSLAFVWPGRGLSGGSCWGGSNALLPHQPSLDSHCPSWSKGEGARPSQLGQVSPSFLLRGTDLART